MTITADDAVPRLDSSPKPSRRKSGQAREPYVLKFGPVDLAIPQRVLPRPMLNLIVGAGLTLSLMSGAESLAKSGTIPLLTNWLFPPQTVTEVSDARTGAAISPARKTYVVKPEQALVFRQQPGAPQFWVSILTEGYGTVDPHNQAAPDVRFYAPSLRQGEQESAGLIQTCTGNPTDPERARCDPPIAITTRLSVR